LKIRIGIHSGSVCAGVSFFIDYFWSILSKFIHSTRWYCFLYQPQIEKNLKAQLIFKGIHSFWKKPNISPSIFNNF
jgi:hypothetical protein